MTTTSLLSLYYKKKAFKKLVHVSKARVKQRITCAPLTWPSKWLGYKMAREWVHCYNAWYNLMCSSPRIDRPISLTGRRMRKPLQGTLECLHNFSSPECRTGRLEGAVPPCCLRANSKSCFGYGSRFVTALRTHAAPAARTLLVSHLH